VLAARSPPGNTFPLKLNLAEGHTGIFCTILATSTYCYSKMKWFFFLPEKAFKKIQVTGNRNSDQESKAGTNTGYPYPTEQGGKVFLHPFPIKVGTPPRSATASKGQGPILPGVR